MKRTTWIWIVAALFALALPTWAPAQDGEGARVYSDNCARCHRARAPWEFSDTHWDIIIHHMHVRGYLTEQERKAVLRYLQANNFRAAYVPAVPGTAAGAADGEALVAGAGCQGCHIIGGEGGTIGPSLDTLYQRRDEQYVMTKLSDPTFDNPASVMPYFGFSEEQKRAIAAYLKEAAQ